jgi:amidohydrolase
MVTNLQHVVSRNTDPIDNLVVLVTTFAGGTADNVIPGTVELTGTVRSFDPELRRAVPGIMVTVRGRRHPCGDRWRRPALPPA